MARLRFGAEFKTGAVKLVTKRISRPGRAQHLLTGRLFCTCHRGQLSNVGRDYLARGAARKRDTCTNMASIRRSQPIFGALIQA
jgi:hypothetical protein